MTPGRETSRAENRDSKDERLNLLLDAWMLFNHWPDHRL